MKPAIYELDWECFDASVNLLASKIVKSPVRFDRIIAVARGGVPLGMLLSDILDLPMEIIRAKSYTGIGKRGDVQLYPGAAADLRHNTDERETLLVVDDMVDSGETMKAVIRLLWDWGYTDGKVATLYCRPDSKPKPDFYLSALNEWVVFPWERREYLRSIHEAPKSILARAKLN